jgi:hypothetical protein
MTRNVSQDNDHQALSPGTQDLVPGGIFPVEGKSTPGIPVTSRFALQYKRTRTPKGTKSEFLVSRELSAPRPGIRWLLDPLWRVARWLFGRLHLFPK